MSNWLKVPVLFKIDRETLNRLDTAANELGHTRSLFIRRAINKRIADYESHEKNVIMSLRDEAPNRQSGNAPKNQ